MDLYQVYDLPPPHPPTGFSRNYGPDRAALPALLALYPNDPAAQANAFKVWLRRTIFWNFDQSAGYFIQLKLNAGIICMLVALVLLIVLRRMHERSFWIIRFARKREGTIVIPNAVNCFTAMEGIYGVLAIALAFEWSTFFEYQNPPRHVYLWLLLPWVSLIWGAAYSCWGALLAAPERDADGKLHRFTLRSVVRRPLLANLICLLLPLAQSISVVIPAILANAKGESALNGYLAWEAKYDNATSIDRDMLLEGADIYNNNLDGIYYACIGFSLWSFWAFSFFLIYTKIVYGLFLDILRHTKLLRSNLPTDSISWKTRIQRSFVRGSSSRESGASDMEKMHTTSDHGKISNPRALAAPDDYTGGSNFPDGDEEQSSSRRRKRDVLQAEMPMATETLHIFSRQEVAEDLPNTSFFPPVKPSKVLPPQNLTGTSSRAAHAKLFRRLLVNFGFQFAGICVAVLVYLAIALFLAIEYYASLESNDVGSTVGPAVLAAFYAASIFGSVTLFAIALRTYEQAVPAGAVSNPTRETPAFNAGAFTVPPEPSAKSPTIRSKPRFTRATKKATEIAADQTYAGSDRDSSIEEPIDDLPRPHRGGSIAMTRVNGSRKHESDASADEAERFEHLAETTAVTHIDHFQYSKEPVPVHKLLTPEDFQRKDRARNMSSPSSPPEETPLSATMSGPLAPSTRIRHAHQNSLKNNSFGQSRNDMPHQEPWNDGPTNLQSADTSLRPSLDGPLGEASRRDDSDIE